MTAARRILVIAGPNGAEGRRRSPPSSCPTQADCPLFVNADLIAAGLSPFRASLVAVQAARLMLGQIDEHAHCGRSVAFETTLSGREHARRIPRWRAQRYRVKQFFLRLPTAESAIGRVAQRVSEGGHDVPEPVIRSAIPCGLAQLRARLPRSGRCQGRVRQFGRRSETGRRGESRMSTRRWSPAQSARDPDVACAETALHRAARLRNGAGRFG